jgi:malate dehydrogenase
LLAEREQVRRVLLIDPDEGRAKGKALDLLQSGPVEGSDTRIEGRAGLEALEGLDAIVVADLPELAGPDVVPLRVADFVRGLLPSLGKAALVVAGPDPGLLLAAAIERGVARDRVLGSAPIAWSAALRRLLAEAVGVEPSAVTAIVLGRPPDLVPVGVSVGGIPVAGAGFSALGRALEKLKARSCGPVSLAAAAARALAALDGSRASLLPVVVALDDASFPRGVALAVPARIAASRVQGLEPLDLTPRERLAFDNAAARSVAL